MDSARIIAETPGLDEREKRLLAKVLLALQEGQGGSRPLRMRVRNCVETYRERVKRQRLGGALVIEQDLVERTRLFERLLRELEAQSAGDV